MHSSFCFLESCVIFFEVPTFLGQNPHFHFQLLLKGLRGCKNKEKNISFSLKIFVHMGVVDLNFVGTKEENLTINFSPQENLPLSLSGELYSHVCNTPPGLEAVTGGEVLFSTKCPFLGKFSQTIH